MGWRSARAALGVLMLGAAATAAASGRVEATAGGEGARIALIGQFEYAQEAVAWRLVDGGIYDVDVGTQGVGSATDLLLVTVSAIDGPMPSLPSALETLGGASVPHVAIALTATSSQPDAELQQLVIIETREVLARYGLSEPEVPVVPADDANFVDQINAILDAPPGDYTIAPPTSTTEPALVVPQSVLGVPYPSAVDILAADGVPATVVVDPTAGVVSECYPQVLGQYPEPGTAVPAGSTVVLAVAEPDALAVGDGCQLPEFGSEAEFEDFVAQVLAGTAPPD